MFVVDRKRSQSATKTRSSSLLLGCPFMVPSRLRGPRRGAGPPAPLSGKNAKGHLGPYAFLLTERRTGTPMDRARLRRYDPPYRVLPITQPSPEGDGPRAT